MLKRLLYCWLFLLLLLLCDVGYAKTILIKTPTDLQGKELVLSKRDKLVFKKQGCLKNGKITGNSSKIVIKTNAPVFQNVVLKGRFKNTVAYLSWWLCEEDITDELSSLLSAFKGTIHIDVSGIVSESIIVKDETNLLIDGCGSSIEIKDVDGIVIFLRKAKRAELHNLHFIYLSSNPAHSSHLGALRMAHAGNSKIKLDNVSVTGFNNFNYKPCGIDAIQIEGCNEGTRTTINNVTVKDMIVKGDGKETNGIGSNYAISVDCHYNVSGQVDISNCHIENLYNVNENGERIYEDTSGIYLGGATGKDKNGQMHYCNWNAIIRDCHFKDVSKRNIKIQGNNVSISNIFSTTTDSFLKSYKNMYVGIEGNNIIVNGIYGKYDGVIVKMTGDDLTLRNLDCSSSLRDSKYAHVIRLDGTQNAVIEDCRFDNDTYMFIYPTERGFTNTTIPEYHIKRCNLNLKHLIYCIKDYEVIYNKGVLIVEDSDVQLSNTYCYNNSGLADIRFVGTKVKTQGQPFSKKKDGTPRIFFDSQSVNIIN